MRFAVELIMLAVLLVCAWSGYKKGLVMGVGTIIAIVISLYMGNLLSETFSPQAAPVLKPFISGYMDGTEGVVGDKLDELLGSSGDAKLSVEDVLKNRPEVSFELAKGSYTELGVYERTAEKMAAEAVDYTELTGTSLTASIVDVMCDNLTYYIGFILFFILILIIITVLGNIFNLSFKIPGQDKLNDIGGLVCGVVIGIVFCIIIAGVLKFLGILLPEEEMRKTLITGLFLKLDILSRILAV